MIRSRPVYLQPVWRSDDWQLFRVEGSPGLISGPGRLVRLDADRLLLEADGPGRLLVRVRHTPYWDVTSGDACVRRAPGGWTEVEVARPGRVALVARLGSPLRLGRQPACSDG
jgi:hypothetical protein